MTEITQFGRESCPECGAETESITDVYRGDPAHIDNFDEARERLTVEETEMAVHPDHGGAVPLAEAREAPDWGEWENRVEIDTRTRVVGHADDDENRGVVTTERWCTDCDWSERLA